MSTQDFAYWLQGFFELRAADPEMANKPITAAQEQMIRDHLALVFTKVTPAVPGVPAPIPFIPTTTDTPWWWRDQIICTGTRLGGTSIKLCAREP